jgi:hypothetical protein
MLLSACLRAITQNTATAYECIDVYSFREIIFLTNNNPYWTGLSVWDK